MNHKLFVYGTLMIPEVQEALLQKRLKSESAILKNYSANCIIYGQYITEYPFLKSNNGNELNGKVLYPISGLDLSLIKYYEGSEYVLTDIIVQIMGKEEDVKTFMLKKTDRVEYGPEWEVDKFIREYLDEYVVDVIPELLLNYNL